MFKLLRDGFLVALVCVFALWGTAQGAQVHDMALGDQFDLDFNEEVSHIVRFGAVRVQADLIDPTDAEYDEFIRVRVSQKGGQSYVREFEGGFAKFINIGAFALDRDGTPSIVLQNYTGGAHCCMEIYALYLGDQWIEADLGLHDGATYDLMDVDGDGFSELWVPDGRFFYTFDAYANSYVPGLVLATRGGDYVDLTSEPSFQHILLEDYEYMSAACLGLDTGDEQFTPDFSNSYNSACASVLSIAARLGTYYATRRMLQGALAGRGRQEHDWDEYTFGYNTENEVTYDNVIDAADHALREWGILN